MLLFMLQLMVGLLVGVVCQSLWILRSFRCLDGLQAKRDHLAGLKLLYLANAGSRQGCNHASSTCLASVVGGFKLRRCLQQTIVEVKVVKIVTHAAFQQDPLQATLLPC